ncbi:hypothetical protein BTR14_16805 [Rhizobium rhizosphaerae]|uniref:Probable membrane transporter protein n=1 Tax=Xaviernesmea rhizosphaerae TaxID=1672749 RepID=A0ABX3PBB4_9HYPH|nr:sulfite exporter TauE/SafE family protein [Xaviernesmea rhizosphaerae]OQP85289.1 hypothetical protein BTR14_16805 [Xaviernesmea rhizosphaerae]
MIEQFLTVHPLSQIGFLALAALVGGLARGFSGFGGALIFVPVASRLAGPQIAAPLLLTIDGLLTLGMLPNGWRKADRREVATLLVGALAGVPAGTLLLRHAPTLTLRWIICAIVAALLVLLILGWRYHGKPRPHLGVTTGLVAGLFGGVAQLSGPPVVAYWLGGAIAAAQVRANLVVYFALSTLLTATSYLWSGLLTGEVLLLALAVGPAYGLGLFAGARLFGLADDGTFRRICLGLIACAAVIGLPWLDHLLG